MGKASKWFRGLLGLKKQEPSSSYTQNPSPTKPTKKKWSFVKSYREKDSSFARSNDKTLSTNYGEPDGITVDPAKRAIAVAEATAVVAEAAIAAAQAAAAVVKLTSSGRANTTSSSNSASGGVADVMTWNGVAVNSSAASSAPAVNSSRVPAVSREESAAIVIQSHFRAYLSRRALRALKGLVKLQALVRGHLLRQHTADYFRQMQALIRAQVRARAGRSQLSDSPHSSSKSVHFLHADPTTPEKFEHVIRARSDETFMLKRNTSRSSWKAIDPEKARVRPQGSSGRTTSTDDEKSDRILELDSGKPYVTPKRRNLFHSLNSDQYSYSLTTSKESTARQTVPSPSSCGNPAKINEDLEEVCFCTADNSPQFYSASSKGCSSSKRGPFTPTKSDGYLSGYSDHPNYMSYTESAKAKVRSMSAPKQRHHYESSSSTKRFSVHGYSESRTNSHKGSFYGSFTGKAYPGSGRLDRLGMPVRADPSGFSGGLQHRY